MPLCCLDNITAAQVAAIFSFSVRQNRRQGVAGLFYQVPATDKSCQSDRRPVSKNNALSGSGAAALVLANFFGQNGPGLPRGETVAKLTPYRVNHAISRKVRLFRVNHAISCKLGFRTTDSGAMLGLCTRTTSAANSRTANNLNPQSHPPLRDRGRPPRAYIESVCKVWMEGRFGPGLHLRNGPDQDRSPNCLPLKRPPLYYLSDDQPNEPICLTPAFSPFSALKKSLGRRQTKAASRRAKQMGNWITRPNVVQFPSVLTPNQGRGSP